MTAFGIVVILHSLIDGLCLGIFDYAVELCVIAASVIIHKIPIAYSVGQKFA